MRNAGDRNWAYITFASNRDACIALTMQPCEKNPVVTKIFPAFTWKQPPVVQESTNTSTSRNSNELSLLMLNDDCLREIFRYCDLHTQAIAWKVCQKLRNILEEYVLRKIDEYTIDFLNGEPYKRLKRVHDELQCIGPHVKRLCLSETYTKYCPVAEWRRFKIYLQHCSKYVGASLKELRIGIPSEKFLNGNFEILQPLLLQVESLYVLFDYDTAYKLRFDIHAPKLKSLILDIDQRYHDGRAKENA